MLSDSLGKPQGALKNPKGDQEPKLSLVDTEPGRRRVLRDAVTPASPSNKSQRRFESHVKYAVASRVRD
jgi:hypothetical protein